MKAKSGPYLSILYYVFFPPIALLLSISNLCQAKNWIFNNPYPNENNQDKIYYSFFTEQPKTLDPARSYTSAESQFVAQIYEPLLQYNYLKRPYTLEPLTVTKMPKLTYLNQFNQTLISPKMPILTVYRITIKKGIFFQPHPALAKDKAGDYLYLNLPKNFLSKHHINKLTDFKVTGTRELLADDYIYQIKRLANPAVNSPIYGLMSDHIVGFREYAQTLPKNEGQFNFIDLRKYPMKGLIKIDNYTFEIKVNKQYPQFLFWLAMPFFSPIPWEADYFYSQAGMSNKNISFDWYPIGTGPFMLTENNPNRRMTLTKNPNFHPEYFPTQGTKEDKAAGFLYHAGEILPLIHKAIFTLEKESIPRWNKFLQGYYDLSEIATDSFNQAIHINRSGEPTLTPSMREKKIQLSETTDPSIYYLGFNMLDPVVGGLDERARKLRLAISIAVNFEDYIAIFYNGRGKAAQGPIPPGIFGYKEGLEGINPYVYRWDGRRAKKRSLREAKQLLREAGYANGIDPNTGKTLILNYDVSATGGPDEKALLDWMRKQFARINIDLNIRATLYNRFQEKIRTGNAQLFSFGWNADYPDPENFLFLLYGPNGRVNYKGENAANYQNAYFDSLFDRMKNLPNNLERQKLIDAMVNLVRHDAPWAFGITTQTLLLSQTWVSPSKPNTIDKNWLKYIGIDVKQRNYLRAVWNEPILWPIGLLLLVVILLFIPILFGYYKKEKRPALRIKL